VLIDYFGHEIRDALEVCRAYPDLAAQGELRVRLDTHGGRYVEGLDMAASYAVLEKHKPRAVRHYRSETELKWLVGTGVSAAALFHLRDSLDEAGFDKVKIIASSGFGPDKCKIMASAGAPIDVISSPMSGRKPMPPPISSPMTAIFGSRQGVNFSFAMASGKPASRKMPDPGAR